jgi:hypothetical protein
MGASVTNQNYIQKLIESRLISVPTGPVGSTWQGAPSQGYMAGREDTLPVVGNLYKGRKPFNINRGPLSSITTT